MINIILLILLLLLILIFNIENFYNIDNNIIDDIYDNNNNITDIPSSVLDVQLLNNYKIENDFNCYLYGCNSSRNDMIEWIGVDSNNNNILTDNINYFSYNNGKLDKIKNYDKNNIIMNQYIINIPIINENNNIKLKVNLNYLDYTFNGYLTNNYYNIQYLVYIKPINTDIENDLLYSYIAVKIIEDEYKIIHKIPPRQKIENLEIVWINYGSIQLGPLIFTSKI
jgi:hypothetical protein